MKQSLIYALTAALVTALAIKAAPAVAQDTGAPQVRIVSTSDLNLGSSAGQKALDIRLARAARDLCGTASDSDLEGKNDVRTCRNQVMADGKAQSRKILAEAESGRIIAVAAAR